jgi:hypothetical protein
VGGAIKGRGYLRFFFQLKLPLLPFAFYIFSWVRTVIAELNWLVGHFDSISCYHIAEWVTYKIKKARKITTI